MYKQSPEVLHSGRLGPCPGTSDMAENVCLGRTLQLLFQELEQRRRRKSFERMRPDVSAIKSSPACQSVKIDNYFFPIFYTGDLVPKFIYCFACSTKYFASVINSLDTVLTKLRMTFIGRGALHTKSKHKMF